MKLLKPLLPILWAAKQAAASAQRFCSRLEFEVLIPVIDKIDRSYLDKRWAKFIGTKVDKVDKIWYVVDFKDDFVLCADLSLEQANTVLDENYGGLMAVQWNQLTPTMRDEVLKNVQDVLRNEPMLNHTVYPKDERP